MKNNKKMIEDALLSGKSLDEIIKLKLREEMQSAFKKVGVKFEKRRIYDIKSVPQHELFGKKSVFKKYNKTNNTISYINGIQAESMLGMDNISRDKLIKGEIDLFSTDNAFIKFEYADIIVRS
ncbi:hypothetical protein IKE67_09235 [bacterium]|nr:hypothetical protein [bacterium]